MTSRWIKVPEMVMYRAARVMDPTEQPDSVVKLIVATGTLTVHVNFVRAVIDYLSEDLGCDHAVNICTCEEQELVRDLTLALDGKRVCPVCHGDGQVWSQEAFTRNLSETIQKTGWTMSEVDERYGDQLGYDDCIQCQRSGVIVIGAMLVTQQEEKVVNENQGPQEAQKAGD